MRKAIRIEVFLRLSSPAPSGWDEIDPAASPKNGLLQIRKKPALLNFRKRLVGTCGAGKCPAANPKKVLRQIRKKKERIGISSGSYAGSFRVAKGPACTNPNEVARQARRKTAPEHCGVAPPAVPERNKFLRRTQTGFATNCSEKTGTATSSEQLNPQQVRRRT